MAGGTARRLTAARARAETAAIDARIAELEGQTKRGLLLWQETIPEWGDVAHAEAEFGTADADNDVPPATEQSPERGSEPDPPPCDQLVGQRSDGLLGVPCRAS